MITSRASRLCMGALRAVRTLDPSPSLGRPLCFGDRLLYRQRPPNGPGRRKGIIAEPGHVHSQ